MTIAHERTWTKMPVDTLRLLQIVAFAFLSWYLFKPAALSDEAWRLFCIFVATIALLITKPLPMGAIALSSIAVLTATKTVTLQTALEGFAYDQLWLIVFACFLARGFIKTGLGRRIAYGFVSFFGGSPYGMSYGLVVSSACMAPLIPSVTARTGGIILPVLRSIVSVVGKSAQGNLAGFLTFVVMHASVITSAMFVTANAANPIVVKFAYSMGIEISWLEWAKAAIVPGVVSLLLVPVILKFFNPCSVDDAKIIQEHAREEISQMGKISWQEKTLLVVFSMLLCLWSFGSFFAIHATEAALFGVALLMVAKVLTWKDVLEEELAWDTFIWMGILIMMAQELQNLGVIAWFTDQVAHLVPATTWQWQLLLLAVIYYYCHYFFASVAAHVSSMYGPFLAIAVTAGAPPLISALVLGFLSSLFGALTHYSSGPAPILFSERHVDIKAWWKMGFFLSIFYIVVWMGLGMIWWNYLDII